jgi:hypothetical protein|tara:strand:- start:17 stop:679 length:663 start_codon:yes stop_codon:yes gene_type:complete
MANTTFNGAVRSENGFKKVTKSSTGAFTDNSTYSSNASVGGTLTSTGATSVATTAQDGMAVGTGISAVAAAVNFHSVVQVGDIIETTILIDVTGLKSTDDTDIIGKADTANCTIGQITADVNGTIHAASMTCLETPTTGEPDIDVYAATVATGAEDAVITGLTETKLLDTGADWTGILGARGFQTMPAADGYLYLVTSGGADTGVYASGKFLLKFYGTPA